VVCEGPPACNLASKTGPIQGTKAGVKKQHDKRTREKKDKRTNKHMNKRTRDKKIRGQHSKQNGGKWANLTRGQEDEGQEN
jgi:hypothetical protein